MVMFNNGRLTFPKMLSAHLIGGYTLWVGQPTQTPPKASLDILNKKTAIAKIICPVIFTAAYITLTGCSRQMHPVSSAIKEIERYEDINAMSVQSEYARIEEIANTLNSKDGFRSLVVSFNENRDAQHRIKLLYVLWHMSFKADTPLRKDVASFAYGVLRTENDLRLQKWAAAILVLCAETGMEDVFQTMLSSQDPALWNHGVRGLWRIASTNAMQHLTNTIALRGTNVVWLKIVHDIAVLESNHWTPIIMRLLSSNQSDETIR